MSGHRFHLRIPSREDKIFKDECVLTFQSPEDDNGVFICMKHFVAVSQKWLLRYSELSSSRTFLQYKIKKELKPQVEQSTKSRPTKVALGVPGGFDLPQDRYTVTEEWALLGLPSSEHLHLPCPADTQSPTDTSHLDHLSFSGPGKVAITTVQLAESALLVEERAREAAVWEENKISVISKYAMDLRQLNNGVRIPPSGWQCSSCELKDNLWLNLTDGSINCGRRFWDGTGGNNHAVDHYERTKYPLAVKLGTITPESADVYSYAEDFMVSDPKLAEHLAHFGIDIMRMQKTDKSMAEMEVSANERLGEWVSLQESDHSLSPRYGPGMTGLRNLGNTCYMNAIIQVLFAIPQFRWLYAYRTSYWIEDAFAKLNGPEHLLPVDHIGLQFAKLGHGISSGLYSPAPPAAEETEQLDRIITHPPGIRPQLFRRLMGLHNAQFATKHQQDSLEFMVYLLELLDLKASSFKEDKPNARSKGQTVVVTSKGLATVVPYPSHCMRFGVEDRLECGFTHKVKYSNHTELALTVPVPMEAMVNASEVKTFKLRRFEAEASGLVIPDDEVVRPRIPLEACLSSWAASERIENFRTPASSPPGILTHACRSSRLLNFPDCLCIQVGKYTIGEDWLPRKLDVEIELTPCPSNVSGSCANFRLDLSALRSPGGPRLSEELFPDEEDESANRPSDSVTPSKPQPNATFVEYLQTMGFSLLACRRACMMTNNVSPEVATNWLLEHLDDPTLNDPLPEEQQQPTLTDQVNQPADEHALLTFAQMGFNRSQALRALRSTQNNLEAAVDWALANPNALGSDDFLMRTVTSLSGDTSDTPSPAQTASNALEQESTRLTDGSSVYELFAMVSHMGASTSTGHYVAHIKRSALSRGIPIETLDEDFVSTVCDGTDDEWIIFNDEKVAKSESPPFGHAYLYFFRRLDSPRD